VITDELLSRQQNLEATKTKLQDSLEKTLHDLNLLTEVDPVDPAELVGLQGSATNLTGSIARIDRALETVDRQLSNAQAAQRRAAQLDLIEDSATAAVAATAREQNEYDELSRDLERIFARILAAAEHGQDARRHLRGLLKAAAPALALLGSPTTYSAAREAEARELEAEMTDRGVGLRAALEPAAEFRFYALLPLIEAWQRNQHLEAIA
jgi:small-conductance mechanosensitive channel